MTLIVMSRAPGGFLVDRSDCTVIHHLFRPGTLRFPCRFVYPIPFTAAKIISRFIPSSIWLGAFKYRGRVLQSLVCASAYLASRPGNSHDCSFSSQQVWYVLRSKNTPSRPLKPRIFRFPSAIMWITPFIHTRLDRYQQRTSCR